MGSTITQTIAPAHVLRGEGLWPEALDRIASLGRQPLVLGRSAATASIRTRLLERLVGFGLSPKAAELGHDCCEEDLARMEKLPELPPCDLVMACGGGKVLDAGKLLADRLELPCVTVPTSAATCAGWTALANLYSPSGAFIRDVALRRCPELLLFDHSIVGQAPARTLASGIADAMAKWYEASVSSGGSEDGLVQQAVQMARILRDQLLLEGQEAMGNPGGAAWRRVAEASALTAGLIGGLGGPAAAPWPPMPCTTASPSCRPATAAFTAKRWASACWCSCGSRSWWGATVWRPRPGASSSPSSATSPCP